MKIKLKEFDSTKYLTSPAAIKAYLDSAFASGDTGHIINALGNVIKARGMTKTAKKAKLDRSNLYDSFVKVGSDPRISTVSRIIDTLGYQLSLKPKTRTGAAVS